jgi:hypothetical protein
LVEARSIGDSALKQRRRSNQLRIASSAALALLLIAPSGVYELLNRVERPLPGAVLNEVGTTIRVIFNP